PRFVFLAPHAQARARAVAYAPAEPAGVGPSAPAQQPGADPPRPAPEPSVVSTPEVSPDESRTGGTEKPRRWAWADLMRRVFDLDVLACPRCGGRMSVIATIEARDVIRTILGHLGLPTEPPAPLPPRLPGRSISSPTTRRERPSGTGPSPGCARKPPRRPQSGPVRRPPGHTSAPIFLAAALSASFLIRIVSEAPGSSGTVITE